MHSFVTGNTGFIGSVLVDCLLLVQAVATYLLSTEIVYVVAQLGLHYSLDALLVVGLIPAIGFGVLQLWVFATRRDVRPQP